MIFCRLVFMTPSLWRHVNPRVRFTRLILNISSQRVLRNTSQITLLSVIADKKQIEQIARLLKRVIIFPMGGLIKQKVSI